MDIGVQQHDIRGTGQFTLRFGGGRALYAAQVRALQEAAERQIPAYSRLGGTERVAALAQLERGRTVESIALDLGYSSASAFIGMFRRLMGVSPDEYRKGNLPRQQ